MARRSSGSLAAVALSLAALWALAQVAAPAFLAPPSAEPLRFVPSADVEGQAPGHFGQAAQAAVLGAVLAAPEAAHAANSGYALLQLGWAVFIIGLGPAVLFWIYFNKPELL
eukprot:CAMPEP_0179108418 /NCGR_PEP_ID=MMETSP0796-20121207/50501_1 /TAXON_ID=73915 /ORGANISM="Pyrodinium bahamense, Strain pbaha01" /LENGTH=111 /DNA_ID=CAMNT_0020806491 /DNA_START=58 /DNA_END=393 /DNA_ORIENTATION=-